MGRESYRILPWKDHCDDTPLAVFKQEDILKQANLKHPMMFDVYDILKEKGIVPKGDVYPKNIAEFQAMVKGL